MKKTKKKEIVGVSKNQKRAIVFISLFCFVFVVMFFMSRDSVPAVVTTTSTTLFTCVSSCITSGVWNASQTTCHDTGKQSKDGLWESDGGFGYLFGCVYVPIKKGCYNVSYEMMKLSVGSNESMVYVEVASDFGLNTPVGRFVYAGEFVQPNILQNISLSFCTPTDLYVGDFRVHTNHFLMYAKFGSIYLTPNLLWKN